MISSIYLPSVSSSNWAYMSHSLPGELLELWDCSWEPLSHLCCIYQSDHDVKLLVFVQNLCLSGALSHTCLYWGSFWKHPNQTASLRGQSLTGILFPNGSWQPEAHGPSWNTQHQLPFFSPQCPRFAKGRDSLCFGSLLWNTIRLNDFVWFHNFAFLNANFLPSSRNPSPSYLICRWSFTLFKGTMEHLFW